MTNEHINFDGPSAHLIDGWTDLWNGDIERAQALCTDDVRVHFGAHAVAVTGDRASGPTALGELIADFRAPRAGLTYRPVEVRTTAAWGYCLWDATVADRHVGGIDTFDFVDGRIARVTSVTGERSMRR